MRRNSCFIFLLLSIAFPLFAESEEGHTALLAETKFSADSLNPRTSFSFYGAAENLDVSTEILFFSDTFHANRVYSQHNRADVFATTSYFNIYIERASVDYRFFRLSVGAGAGHRAILSHNIHAPAAELGSSIFLLLHPSTLMLTEFHSSFPVYEKNSHFFSDNNLTVSFRWNSSYDVLNPKLGSWTLSAGVALDYLYLENIEEKFSIAPVVQVFYIY